MLGELGLAKRLDEVWPQEGHVEGRGEDVLLGTAGGGAERGGDGVGGGGRRVVQGGQLVHEGLQHEVAGRRVLQLAAIGGQSVHHG